jgi:hypothetical protein
MYRLSYYVFIYIFHLVIRRSLYFFGGSFLFLFLFLCYPYYNTSLFA